MPGAVPPGASVQWDAETTCREPPRRLAWRALPGAAVEHAGMVELEPIGPLTRARHRVLSSWRRDCPVCGANCLGGDCGHRASLVAGISPDAVLGDALDLLAAQHRQDRPRPRSDPNPNGHADVWRSYLVRPASRLIVVAMITAPNRYDSSAWRSTVARKVALFRSVSETWKVMPMQKAM